MSNVAKLKKRALEYEQKKQVEKALETYAQILQDLGDHVEEADVALYNRVGDLLLRRGDVAGAVDHYERAVDLYADGGFFNNAIALCNKILRNAPGRNSIYYKLGRISAQKGFVNDAKQNFLEYADRMQRVGQLEEAFRALKEFADLCPDQDDIRLMLADQLVRKDRKAEAIEQLQLLYEKFQREGRTQEARATVDRMKALDPELEPTSVAAEPTPKANDLVFLDVDFDQPFTPSGTQSASAPPVAPARKAPAPPPPRAREVPKPIADLPLIYEGPDADAELDAEVAPLDGLTGSEAFTDTGDEVASDDRVEDGPVSGLEQTVLDADAAEEAEVAPLADLQPGSALEADEEDEPWIAVDLDVPETEADVQEVLPDAAPEPEEPHAPREAQLPDIDEPPVRMRPREPVLHDSSVPPARFRVSREPQLADVDEPPVRLRPRPEPAPPVEEPVPEVLPGQVPGLDEALGEEPLAEEPLAEEPLAEETATARGEAPPPTVPDDDIFMVPGASALSPHDEEDEEVASLNHLPLIELPDDESDTATIGGELSLIYPDDDPLDAQLLQQSGMPEADEAMGNEAPDPASELTFLSVDDDADDAPGVHGSGVSGSALDALRPLEPEAFVPAAESKLEPELEVEPEADALDDATIEQSMTDMLAASHEHDTPEAPDPRLAYGTPTSFGALLEEELRQDAAATEGPPEAPSEVARLRAELEGRPGDIPLRRRLAEAMFEEGDRDGGLAELEHAMVNAEHASRLDEANAVAEELTRLEPASVRYHQKLVEYAVRSSDRGRLAQAYLSLGDCLLRGGEMDKARAVYARVIELAPGDERARNALRTLGAEEAEEPAPPPPAARAPEPPRAEPRVPTPRAAPRISAPAPAPAPAPPPAAAPAPARSEEPAGAEAAAGGDGDFVNLSDWLREDEPSRNTRMVADVAEPQDQQQVDFAEMLTMFKQGVAANVDETDHESHYDLGVAYKEMGLLDEAISEFQKALRGTEQRVRTYEALGQCFVEKRQYQIALTILSRSLNDQSYTDDMLVGVLYLLGYASEALGRWEDAMRFYERVFAVDIQFRDIGDRLAAVERRAR